MSFMFVCFTQAVQLFMSVAVEQAGIDYHVVLAQNALQQCLDQPELQSEFICVLVKQTSRHTQHRLGVQVKKAAKLVSLGTARVVSPAYCLTKETHVTTNAQFMTYHLKFIFKSIQLKILLCKVKYFNFKLGISFFSFVFNIQKKRV